MHTRLTAPNRTAFTLVELLVSAGILAALVLAAAGACRSILAKQKTVREIAAGRNLIGAYLRHAVEHDGRYLPGMDYSVPRIRFEPENRDVSVMHAAHRYPFRLAPSLDYRLEGSILLPENTREIEKIAAPGTPMHDYIVSAFPAFGINYYFVGGCVTGSAAQPNLVHPAECVSRMSQGHGGLLVFASAGTTDGDRRIEGFNILTPPRLYGDTWSAEPGTAGSDPGLHGNVDARHQGRAVCVFLDGSVRLLTIATLRDMRMWNANAAENNDPTYTLSF